MLACWRTVLSWYWLEGRGRIGKLRLTNAMQCPECLVTLRIVSDHHEVSLYFRDLQGQWTSLHHGFETSV